MVVPVGADGQVALFNGSTGSTQLVGDVAGYFRSGTPSTPKAFASLTPARVLDTRAVWVVRSRDRTVRCGCRSPVAVVCWRRVCRLWC